MITGLIIVLLLLSLALLGSGLLWRILAGLDPLLILMLEKKIGVENVNLPGCIVQ